MFCPKCATQNVDGASFCRSCGANISLIPQALSGQLPTATAGDYRDHDSIGATICGSGDEIARRQLMRASETWWVESLSSSSRSLSPCTVREAGPGGTGC